MTLARPLAVLAVARGDLFPRDGDRLIEHVLIMSIRGFAWMMVRRSSLVGIGSGGRWGNLGRDAMA